MRNTKARACYFLFVAALCLGFSSFVFAQDSGLYDPAPAPGSAFVRFINLSDTETTLRATNKLKRLAAPYSITPYMPVKAGTANFSIGKTITTTHTTQEGQFYSAALHDNRLIMLTDTAPENPAKAVISFYNFTKAPLALKTADGAAEIFPPATPGKNAHREINGVDVNFGLYDGTNKKTETGPILLRRRQTFSVIAYNKDTEIRLIAQPASLDTAP